uniref:Uncharacterized protein n=1 Tax=Tetranychus urticae TaxID=32264 RepID=T1JTQ6_TETUR
MSLDFNSNVSFRLIHHSSSAGIDEAVFDTMKNYASIIIGEVPFEWINGGHEQHGHCHSPICSTPFLQSIQSGLNDASFPPESMDDYLLIPENMSFTSVMGNENCAFLNLYTDKSVKSKYPGILTSFQVIELNVYILVGLLFVIGALIYSVREKSLPWPFKGTTSQLINGRFGFIILATCYLAIFCVSKLLSSSFATNYSIASRAPPINDLDDLKKSTQRVVAVDNLYCALKSKEDSFLAQRFHLIGADKPVNYLYDHLSDERIVAFDSSRTLKTSTKVFCNLMTNVKKSTNFYVNDVNRHYFDTLHFMAYYKHIEKHKKRFLQRAAYSCLEMGYCFNAFDRAFSKVAAKRITFYKTNAQCESYKQIKSYPVLYHPIAFITIQDLIHLLAFLLILSCLVYIIELLRESKRNRPLKLNKPFSHYPAYNRWYFVTDVKTVLSGKRLTNVYPMYDSKIR